MRVARTKAELAQELTALPGRRAVVMTMGALHDGHLTLVRRAHELADVVLATVFVNPLQFGPTEDLDRYPRDLDGDLAKLEAEGVDLVFAPERAEVYPAPAVVTVSSGRIGQVLEGEFRPVFFDGVLTVVLKLLHLTAPDVALFGEKDAQQLAVVRRMVADLDVPVQIVGVATVREPDGLAMSSRNAYLSESERGVALALSRALAAGRDAALAGAGPDRVHAAAATVLAAEPGVRLDYLALTDPALEQVEPGYRGPALLLVAGWVGSTRLIDNMAVVLGPSEGTADRTEEL